MFTQSMVSDYIPERWGGEVRQAVRGVSTGASRMRSINGQSEALLLRALYRAQQ